MWPFKKRVCVVVGHRYRLEKRVGYEINDHRRRGYCVADDVEQEREICRDCKFSVEGWVTGHSSCIQSLEMDSDRMRKLEREGFIRR